MTKTFMIHIPRRSATCFVGHEPLQQGDEYFSLLTENEKSEYERKDFCVDCWQNTTAKHELKQSMKYWKSKVVKKSLNAPPQTKNAQILSVLKNSLEKGVDFEESFVLALYLARVKMIVLRKEIREKEEILQVYEVIETEEMLVVKKMELSKLKTEEIQAKIASALSNKEA